ncbi:MAG: CCA tRNA nucleotidyltransferase [Thermofilum sp. ex4484_79]|nr:MAG: CCA tRNA nucleotidyltransferase [Thermofilum sp. ex4484_79]
MSGIDTILSIKEKVLKGVTPSEEERRKIDRIASEILSTVNNIIKERGYEKIIKAEFEGSYAKDTWLSGEVDLDLFLLFDASVNIQELREIGVEIGKKAGYMLKSTPIEQYATHPYIQFYYDGIKIEIIPAYRVSSADKIMTPVDRTPFHTSYVRKKISENPQLKKEIRILKKFLKGIEVYGAEIKVGGFSGYLTELLAIHYKSFENVLLAAKNWVPWHVFIDISQHYRGRDTKDLMKYFNSPLIVIDPVDKNRNAAAAVTLKKLSEFIIASKSFLLEPSIKYFYPQTLNIDHERVRYELARRQIVSIKVDTPKNVNEEILWGQLKRIKSSLFRIMESNKLKVFDSTIWVSDDFIVLLFELERLNFPPLEEHIGPPLYSKNLRDFLAKYNRDKNVVGPFIKDSRPVVLRKTRYNNVVEVISEYLPKIKMSKDLSTKFKDGLEILTGEKIYKYCSNSNFCLFLQKWLTRKFPWIY